MCGSERAKTAMACLSLSSVARIWEEGEHWEEEDVRWSLHVGVIGRGGGSGLAKRLY